MWCNRVYIYTHIYIYTYACIYIYIHVCVLRNCCQNRTITSCCCTFSCSQVRLESARKSAERGDALQQVRASRGWRFTKAMAFFENRGPPNFSWYFFLCFVMHGSSWLSNYRIPSSHVFFGGTHPIFTLIQMSWNGDEVVMRWGWWVRNMCK